MVTDGDEHTSIAKWSRTRFGTYHRILSAIYEPKVPFQILVRLLSIMSRLFQVSASVPC
jgi:hypothetical protein